MVTRLVCCCWQSAQKKASISPDSGQEREPSINPYSKLSALTNTQSTSRKAHNYGSTKINTPITRENQRAISSNHFKPRTMSPSTDKKLAKRKKKRTMDSATIIAVACASLKPFARNSLKVRVNKQYKAIQGKVKKVEEKKNLQDIAKSVLQGIILKKLERLKTCEDHLAKPVTASPDKKEKKRVWDMIDKMVNYDKKTSVNKMAKHERLWLYLVQEIRR